MNTLSFTASYKSVQSNRSCIRLGQVTHFPRSDKLAWILEVARRERRIAGSTSDITCDCTAIAPDPFHVSVACASCMQYSSSVLCRKIISFRNSWFEPMHFIRLVRQHGSGYLAEIELVQLSNQPQGSAKDESAVP